ncbi:(Fe-S)-binding protein [Archaeoglobus fulgidus]|uniref:Fe-S oxidoreductase n=1 Tax=Archaeoglobus fulgidus DSM 8774 TaxID=1344584 RepID=A0A075WAD8_ARCFL|nr:(Fe-S)-binding protein [Archaeoglobus fulgidus]AIG97360.1 Fe-S oxidoreductase [Archaeoglobus fulgidus DSM 8774]
MVWRKKDELITVQDIALPYERLAYIHLQDLLKLPPPYDSGDEPELQEPNPEWSEKYVTELDGYIAIDEPWKPQSEEEEKELVERFLSGLRKLLDREANWTFLQPLMLSLEYCARCQTCSEACPIYVSSGRKEIYRPTYRSEVLRRIIKRYLQPTGGLLGKFTGADIELNALTVTRLAELAYRCTLCRRCTQTCPLGIDNGLITREIRKLFSQEMGIAPSSLHMQGTVQHLEKGSSTGLTTEGFKDIIEFIEEEIEERTGKKIKIPVDVKGADILLFHNAGEYLSWPENIAAFAIIFEEAGLDWTLSSEMVGYDAVNYGVWYDDVQFSRIALKHAEIARKLDVNRIVVGECGHAHKALTVIADRIFVDEYQIPRESCLPLLWDIVRKKKLNLDPEKNNFPVTLHDPCNVVRLMGIVEPQRRILNEICPQFREMHPNGVYNYCCGGGSGFAIMNSMNFPEFRVKVASRMKFKQILDAFQDSISPEINKYVCAPCSNCKGAIRDILTHYNATEKCGIYYGGLVELIVNAMVDIEEPFIEMY